MEAHVEDPPCKRRSRNRSQRKESSRLSKVHGWAKIESMFPDQTSPWDQSFRMLPAVSSDNDEDDSSSSSEDEDIDASGSEEEEKDTIRVNVNTREEGHEVSLPSTRLSDPGACVKRSSKDRTKSFVTSLREVSMSISNQNQQQQSFGEDNGQEGPTSVSLSTIDQGSEVGFSYHSRSYHSMNSSHGRREAHSSRSGQVVDMSRRSSNVSLVSLGTISQEQAEEIMKEEVIPHPKETLFGLLKGTKITESMIQEDQNRWHKYFLSDTEERTKDWQSKMARLVSKGNLESVQEHHQHSPNLNVNACNARGESYLQLACRAKSRNVAKYLLQQGASLKVCDKLGRSPLVELCWTIKPDFGLIYVVLQRAPGLLFSMDRRGFLPFQYIPQDVHTDWNEFLESSLNRKPLLQFAHLMVYRRTAQELQQNQWRLMKLLQQRLSKDMPNVKTSN